MQKVFTLRLDEKIFLLVSQNAKKNKRSASKEIEFILEQHYKPQEK